MILKLKSFLAIILCSIVFYSCQKEYSLEGNVVAGTAVFTFAGTPGSCTNALVTGNYLPGTALGPTNIATLSVNVTTAGTYNIATTTVNGIAFAGKGSFSTTGLQTISLAGSGTPIAAGTFSLAPSTGGCSFPVTVTGVATSAVFTLNGAPNACTGVVTAGTYTTGTALGITNTATINVNVTTVGSYAITTNTVNGITFSASGNFTGTGNQPVQLQGSGTPLTAGSFNYTAGTNGCTFSITVAAGSTNAVFTYGGAPNACTTAVPTGFYTVGVPLDASNSVTIAVNTTTAGAYSITTPVVNGISFIGSGNLATGPGTVVLTGTGTPVAGGVFNYTPPNGCSFPITTDFMTCTIDGVARTFNLGVSLDKNTADTISIAGFETASTSSPAFQFILVKQPAVTTGVYPRRSPTNTSIYSIGAYYDDATLPPVWITALSTQTGAFSVTITSYNASATTGVITGTFSGTLYDANGSGTNTKIITNGQFSVSY
ncbi:MAG: hypothetical protein ABIN94_05700 [Ferruginibacter sp.]